MKITIGIIIGIAITLFLLVPLVCRFCNKEGAFNHSKQCLEAAQFIEDVKCKDDGNNRAHN